MGFLGKVIKGASKIALGEASESISNTQKAAYQENRKSGLRIGGKSIQEWDHQWKTVGILSDINLSQYNNDVGLYRAKLGTEVVYIGRAVEWNNGGFRKRLSDYTCDSDSKRKTESSQKIFENRNHLTIDLLIIGCDEQTAKVAKALEGIMVGKHNPRWNKVKVIER